MLQDDSDWQGASSYLGVYFGIPATISDSISQWSEPRRILKNPEDQKYIIIFFNINQFSKLGTLKPILFFNS